MYFSSSAVFRKLHLFADVSVDYIYICILWYKMYLTGQDQGCNLCGSQDSLQRQAIKTMCQDWEAQFPGRIESIQRSMANVSLSQLSDRERFNFTDLRASGIPLVATDVDQPYAPLADIFSESPPKPTNMSDGHSYEAGLRFHQHKIWCKNSMEVKNWAVFVTE